MKNEKTGHTVASKASESLRDPNASALQKSLAGSALAQSGTKKETSAEMATVASRALQDGRVNATTQSLAGSVLTQKD